jgi:outer membrane protein assembly factor BamB
MLALLNLALLLALGGLNAGSQNWAQFRGSGGLTGVSSSRLPETLRLLWTYEAGESVESSPAIVEGTVFVGVQPGDLVAVDLATGRERWKVHLSDEGIGESSPAVEAGVVFIGDLSGMVHAVNAGDGKPLWNFKTASEVKASPVVAGDRVLVGSYDQNLYCLSARTGALAWKFPSNGPLHSTAAISKGRAFVAGCDEILRGVRIDDGQEVLQVSSGAYTGASPAVVNEIAYYGTFNNEVLAVDLTARRILWRYQHPERQFPFYSSAAVSEGKLVVGGRDKLVHCLDAGTGKLLWTFATGARVESSPAIASGRVYIGSNDGRFYVLELASGKKLWEFTAGAPLSSSPAIGSGRVVIGAQDGRLFCFG